MRFSSPKAWLPILLVLAGGILAFAQQGNRNNRQDKPAESKDPAQEVIASDPRLLALHRDFVLKAEKLATEYEKNDPEKARAVYRQILRLLPEYPKAKEALAKLDEKELTAESKTMDIFANKDWQDTGLYLVEGKPVRIASQGEWKFRMEYDLSPEGMEIPKEIRDFKLGSLIGMVFSEDPEKRKPFHVGSLKEFDAETSGRLLLRMHDSDIDDNQGKIQVEITGTFVKSKD